MNEYRLQSTHLCPGDSISLIELSLDSRLLIIGDRRMARLKILDRLTGFRPVIKTLTPSQPTSLTFEGPTSFLVGLDDGRFARYLIDLRSKRLVHQWTNDSLRGMDSITAIALDTTARILALAVGSNVLLFSRLTAIGGS